MFRVKKISRFLRRGQWFGLAVVVSACVDSQGVGPEVFGDAVEFSTDIPAADLESVVGSAAVRVEIELGEEGLVARIVEIKVAEAMAEPEEIRSRVASLSITDASSSLTLELGDLVVGFNGETALRSSEGHELSLERFAGHINEALAAGIPVSIRARRLPADTPQAPDDAEFFASELRLQNDEADRALELNIDGDNLMLNDAPPPDGWITVLGLAIEIRESEGLTEVRHAREDLQHIRFEGQVTSVNLDRHEFALGDDVIVRLIDITKIKFEDGDRHRLPSLAAVGQALRAGKKVFTAGEGVVQSERPLTIIAARVVFEVEIRVEDFWGMVESVALDAMQATLASGMVIQLDEHTKIRFEEGDRVRLPSLEAVAAALRAGEKVFAKGEGEVILESDGSLTIRAFHVLFERELAVEDFAGLVTSVSLDAHTVTLENGTIVRIDDRTRIRYEDGVGHLLPSLAAVNEALAADEAVFAAGEGQVESAADGTPQILAFHIIFEVESVVEEFSGLVESVNLEAHTATLTNGVVVRIGDRTKIRHEEGSLYTLGSLAAVAEALQAGDAVFAAGYGEVESAADGTPRILALHVVFEVDIPVEEFDAAVESVNLDAATFTLSGGLVVKITDHTNISADGDLKTLGGVAEAMEAGQTVIAVGKGRVVVESGVSLIKASQVLFKIVATG